MLRTVSNTYAQVAQVQSCAHHMLHIKRLSHATCSVSTSFSISHLGISTGVCYTLCSAVSQHNNIFLSLSSWYQYRCVLHTLLCCESTTTSFSICHLGISTGVCYTLCSAVSQQQHLSQSLILVSVQVCAAHVALL